MREQYFFDLTKPDNVALTAETAGGIFDTDPDDTILQVRADDGNTYDVVTSSTSTSNQTAGTLYKGWRIPSVTDWRYMLAGLTSNMPTPLSPAYSATNPAGITNDGSIYSDAVLFDVINTAWVLGLSNTNAFLTSSQNAASTSHIFYLISKATNENYFYLITKDFGDTPSSPRIYGRAVFAY